MEPRKSFHLTHLLLTCLQPCQYQRQLSTPLRPKSVSTQERHSSITRKTHSRPHRSHVRGHSDNFPLTADLPRGPPGGVKLRNNRAIMRCALPREARFTFDAPRCGYSPRRNSRSFSSKIITSVGWSRMPLMGQTKMRKFGRVGGEE